jgi:hypothetical protein
MLVCLGSLILGAMPLSADVVYLKDGTILIAAFKASEGDTMIYVSGGKEKRLPSAVILRSEPSLSSLEAKQVTLELTDKSTVEGLFNDYDEDIGYFIDLSFGTLTVPIEKVSRLVDPRQLRKFEGANVAIGVRGLGYVPLGGDYFSSGFGGGIGGEFGLPFFRGLFGGVDLDFLQLNNDTLKDFSYMLILLTPKVTYRYLELRAGTGFASRLAPFASLGLGMTMVYIHDKRPGVYPDNYGAFSPHAKIDLGSDFYVRDNMYVRLGGSYLMVFQEDKPFKSVGANLSLYYEF